MSEASAAVLDVLELVAVVAESRGAAFTALFEDSALATVLAAVPDVAIESNDKLIFSSPLFQNFDS
jgi:hypothetical protein